MVNPWKVLKEIEMRCSLVRINTDMSEAFGQEGSADLTKQTILDIRNICAETLAQKGAEHRQSNLSFMLKGMMERERDEQKPSD